MSFVTDTFAGSAATNLTAYNAAWSKQSGHTGDFFIGNGGQYAFTTATAAYAVYVRSESPASANYSVFADVTKLATSSSVPQMGVVGRAQAGADTFYAAILFCNVNEVRLYKWVSGTPTQLGSGYALTAVNGTAYNLELRMSGSTIKVFVAGVERISATDSSITGAGKAGIIGVNMRETGVQDTGSIDNFDAVDGAATESLTITTPVQYKVHQRSGSTGSISISGTVAGSTEDIEASFNGGAYATISTAVAPGSFSGTLTGQTQGQGTLTVRKKTTTTTSATVADVGIGDVFVVGGDSTSEGRGTNPQSYTHATLKAAKFTQADAWGNGNDGIDTNTTSGSHWPLLATQIMADQSVPVAFISCGTGSTDVAGSANTWAKPGSEYSGMTAQVTDSGVNAVKAVLMHLGPNAVVNASTLSKATYNAAIDTLAANIASDVAGAPKLHIGIFGEVTTGSPPDRRAAIDNLRGAIIEAHGDNANVKPGPCLIDQDYSDGVHPQSDAALQAVAKRWWVAIKESLYSGSGGRGPRLSSAQWNAGRDQLTVVFDRTLKTGLSHSTAAWSISDNGTPMTISGIAYHGSNTAALVITTSAAATGASGTTTVTFASGNDAVGLVVPLSADITMPSGAAIQIPAEPIYAAAVAEGLSIIVTPGAYAITGIDVVLTKASAMQAIAGSYAITGNVAGLNAARILTATPGGYSISGNSVILTYNTVGSYTLNVTAGSYAITGNDVALVASRALAVTPGAYAISGSDVVLTYGVVHTLNVTPGSYEITGYSAMLAKASTLQAIAGAYAYIGRNVVLTYSGLADGALDAVSLLSIVTPNVQLLAVLSQSVRLDSPIP